jgi:hypothetical protein
VLGSLFRKESFKPSDSTGFKCQKQFGYPDMSAVKMAVFWDVALCSLLEVLPFYQSTRRNNPQESHLHARRCDNLKSHRLFYFGTHNSVPVL